MLDDATILSGLTVNPDGTLAGSFLLPSTPPVTGDFFFVTAGDSSGRSAFNVVHIIAPCLRGDVNRSGVINASDAPALVSALLAVSVDPDTFCVADVNGDGQLNGLDIEAFENVLP